MSLGSFNFSSSGRSATLPERINNVIRYGSAFNVTSRNNGTHSYMDEDAGRLYLLSGTTFRRIRLDTNNINTVDTLATAPASLFMFSGLPKDKGYFYGIGSNRTVYRYNILANTWTTRASVGAHTIIFGRNGYDMVDDIADESISEDSMYFKTWHISSTTGNRQFFTFSFYKYIIRLNAAILMYSIQELAEGSTNTTLPTTNVNNNYLTDANIDVQGFTDNHVYFLNGLSEFVLRTRSSNFTDFDYAVRISTSRKIHKELYTQTTVPHEANRASFVRRVNNLVYYYDNINRLQSIWSTINGDRQVETNPATRVGNGTTIRIFNLSSNAWSSGGNSPSPIGRSLGGVYKGNLYTIGGAFKNTYFTYSIVKQVSNTGAVRSTVISHEVNNTNLHVNLLQL